ncbi:hypothetical protein CRUP_022621, partial [Coryphaenoides rupestris]
ATGDWDVFKAAVSVTQPSGPPHTPKLDRSELLGKEGKAKSSMKRKLSFTASPARTDERESDTDKDGPDKKKVKKESGGKKSQASNNLLFGYPLSERKQMALLMQMTANSPDSTPSHPSQVTPVQKRVASRSASKQKDKVNKRNERGETTLHLAAIRGDTKHVKELISLGADVNVKDFAGWTPLHEACNLGYYDVAKVLIGAGAEVNTQGLDDDAPLHDASSSGHKDIVKLLLRHGGNAFQANKRGERPVDVADSQEVERLLKGELPLSDQEDSSSDSEDPPSVNLSSAGDNNMEDSDPEKDSEGKPSTMKASPSMSGLDEYEFKEEEDDDGDKEEKEEEETLNDRHHYNRRDQREKEDRNHASGKPGAKTDPPPSSSTSSSSSRSKKLKSTMRILHCSTDSSSDEADGLLSAPVERRGSPSCSQSVADAFKAEPVRTRRTAVASRRQGEEEEQGAEQEQGEPGGRQGKQPGLLSLRGCLQRRPKDDSSVHLFHPVSIKSPKLNHGLPVGQAGHALKQEQRKDEPCATAPDAVKYNHYTDADYCTEAPAPRAASTRRRASISRRSLHLLEPTLGMTGSRSPYRDGKPGEQLGTGRPAHCARRTRTARQKEARKDGHRNLEFDREFWKENFFQKATRRMSQNHGRLSSQGGEGSQGQALGRQEKRSRDEKEKSVKKERKEEKGKDGKWSDRDERAEAPHLGASSVGPKEELEERAVMSGSAADQDQPEQPSERGARDRSDKRPSTKDREAERTDKRHPEKKIKAEHSDRAEPQNSAVDRWKEKEKSTASSSHSPGDKSHKERENEKLRSLSTTKKHEESRKNKERNSEKRSERERQDRDYNGGEHREKDRTSTDKKGKQTEKPSEHSRSDRSKEKDCDRKKRDKMKDGALCSGSNLKSLLEEKRSYGSDGSKSASLKPKEEVTRTPEKDRDRRDRERDSDRHRDKDRHRERSQQNKLGRAKPNDADSERVKSKASPASRDTRPKEKRLVNDDLMQTSFERMLSLKDQEIEQWHRKHLEKIKQKERERLRQRPSAADSTKSKGKDKATKMETCLSKELLRSKSSEAADGQSRDRPLKDGTGSRTLSLDANTLCSLSAAKVMGSVDAGLSRSPRPDGERSGVMSRSVSMVSVASSEDSCQAAALTPRPAEYDSDVKPEASDSQPPLLQSSLAVLQATKSPSVHDKDCNNLPDVPHSSWSPLSNRHETPYLRAILDEDANLLSSEGKDSDALANAPLLVQPVDEPKAAEPRATEIRATTEPPADPEEGLNDANTLLQHASNKMEGDPDTERGETRPEYFPVSPASHKDTSDKELLNSESNVSSVCGTPSRATEQRVPSSSEAPASRDSYWPMEMASAEGESGNRGSTLDSTTAASSSAITADLAASISAQEAVTWPCPQREPVPFTATESSQPSESLMSMSCDHEEKQPETATNTAERAGQDCEEGAWDPFRREGSASPVPPVFTNIPSFEAEEPLLALSKINAEARCALEESNVHEQPCKKSRTSPDIAADPLDMAPNEKLEHSSATSSTPVSRCVTPEHKAEEACTEPNDDINNNGGVETRPAYVAEGSYAEVSPAPDTAPEERTESGPERTEAPPLFEEMQESSGSGEQGTCQLTGPVDISASTSGCSSPQSGDSDSSGTKSKVRSQDDDPDAPVPHPRKRKMLKASPSQGGAPPAPHPGKEKVQQQSLAAIVDSVKLEQIEPYQTERANPYYEYLHIRKKIEEKRKVLCSVTPQPPQYYDEYVTFNGSYLLDGNPLSKLCIPMITPPPSLPEQLKEMFKQQEVMRMKLRLQHSIEREKLIVSNEQEVLRVHYRAARTLANQTLPFSACTVLLDAEVYNMPQDTDDGKTSVRDRFNARQFMSWLQDTCLLMRQQHEAAALNAVQRLEWQLKLQELEPATYKCTSIFEIPEFYIPLVEVNDDFDLTPI